jgi:autotransporter-associated beta strand protein
MRLPARRGRRSLHYFLIFVTVGGVVLAAETSWRIPWLEGRIILPDWLSELGMVNRPTADDALATAPTKTPDTQFSINRWLNSFLSTAPATAWTASAPKSGSSVIVETQLAPAPVIQSISLLPIASFSSGFISYSNVNFGPLPPVPIAPTASGNWISNASGTWGSTTNWAGGVIANGAGSTAHFDTLDINTPVTVLLETSRTIGNLYIGDTNGTDRYTISPTSSSLTFDSGSTDPFVHSILEQSSTSAGDTMNVTILMNNALDINNLSGANQFTVSGNISPNGNANDFRLLTFNNIDTSVHTAGNILVSGNITDGANGASLSVVMSAGGRVTLTGTNTYTGFTEIDGGTLLINGTNSGPGSVYVYDTGTLGGHGTIKGNVYLFGGTITGDTATTVGALTLQGNVNFATGEGAGGTYLANLSAALSDLLAITGTVRLGAGTTLDIVGSADGVTTYILATFASRNDVFETVMGIPSGYSLVYNATDIELVPTAIPEASTWLGGTLALGFVAFAQRRKRRRSFSQ